MLYLGNNLLYFKQIPVRGIIDHSSLLPCRSNLVESSDALQQLKSFINMSLTASMTSAAASIVTITRKHLPN